MMKSEFEALAGYEVTMQDYTEIIEPMYLATTLNKAEFVKCIDKKRFALRPLKAILRDMKTRARHLEATCTAYTDWKVKDELEALAKEYADRKYGGQAIARICDTQKQCCYYPSSIEIMSRTTFKTWENIALF